MSEYSLKAAIDEFFSQTSATREACDSMAKNLVGGKGKPVPIAVQGNCSYTVYAGPELEFVVQFRLDSLKLDSEISILASKLYGSLVPNISFHGEIGGDNGQLRGDNGKEHVLVYVMNRIRGVSHLDFILENGFPENSEKTFAWRDTLLRDIACFFALTWKSPQKVNQDYKNKLRQTYTKELQLLLHSLPSRFHQSVQKCLDSMDAIFSLPMVLLHRDFGTCNVMVDATSCHLTGVLDWAEAEICPFGLNLHSLQAFTGALHLKNGWRRYEDYEARQNTFWGTFRDEVGGLSEETVRTIKMARVMGLLLSSGFTRRLANRPEATPIRDDEAGRYNMLSLDGFLVNPATKFDGLD
ncbi:hypothetical protein L228DRAFT_241817 [Xylona heveae TC161]|uniref:Aminoglycoside phosphotransferase domain-containing protein n=1 Tax=Xylona heveae (strain CBS 132557 / TC161) TaxID=1328760 RepID=A0A164ZIF2_XYLHT|nr:hypothetical protein L228DRAFT_241817 [Xylona heveae TC161]KZF19139.1 hypothetical protein L228DRAFT_241817 [Xylona heveae TC161]